MKVFSLTRLYFRKLETLQAFLEKRFSSLFGGYSSFGSTYQIIKPKLIPLFSVLFVGPLLLVFLYLFFRFFRFFNSLEVHDPEFFLCVYGTKLDNLVDFFYFFYRYSDVTGYYSYRFMEELRLQYCLDFLSNPRYAQLLNWKFSDIVFHNPLDTYTRVREHIRQTPYPDYPIFPITEAFWYYVTGDVQYYTPVTDTHRFYRKLWLQFFTDVIITITLIPYYIWIDRSDLWFYQEWKLRTIHILFLPTWEYFKLFYLFEVRDYVNGWLAFIPTFSFVPAWFYIVGGGLFSAIKLIFVTFFDARHFLLAGSRFIDYLSLYSSGFFTVFSTSLAVIYGLPFFVFSYLFLLLSLFFLPLRVIIEETLGIIFKNLFYLISPSFTVLENLFSDDARTSEIAWTTLLLEISDFWMWFTIFPYIIAVAYLVFLLVALLWYFSYKPLFFVYSFVYDTHADRMRSQEEMMHIVRDQLTLARLVFSFKWLLILEYFSFVRFHTIVAFVAARDKDVDYLKTLEKSIEPLILQFSAEVEELEEWDKRDREICEEMDSEKLDKMLAEDQAALAEKNRRYTDLNVWSTLGSSPELSVSYHYLVTFMRLTLRPLGYFWFIVSCVGLVYRHTYIRLFMDGISVNVINPMVNCESAIYQDSPLTAFAVTDLEALYDRWIMRWIVYQAGEAAYYPIEIAASVYSYADMILSVYRWFFVGFLVMFLVLGATWLSLKTFRELVAAYWLGAFLAFLYGVNSVFGEAYGYSLLDYSLPFTGFFENWILFLDGWASEGGLTDTYTEMRMYTLERTIKTRRLFLAQFERPAHGWWRYRGVFLYGTHYYRNMVIVDFLARSKGFHLYNYTQPFERFLVWINTYPSRPTPFKHAWRRDNASYVQSWRLWLIKTRKSLGKGRDDSD